MKAVRFHETGGPEVLRYEDAPVPAPTRGQVRIRVAGVAYNPADGGMRGGFLPIPISLPHTPGYDVAGTVDALGEGVDDLEIGDSVIGLIPMESDGAAAEYVVAPAAVLVKAPLTISLADAAGLPSVGLTASQALFEGAGLGAGQRVLINGAGGPVGGYAVQLARRAGAHVIATASARSRGRVEAAGAHEIVDHTVTSLRDAVTEPVDVLLNLAPVTAEGFASLVPLVRDGGVVVSTTPTVPTPGDEARGVRAVTIFVRSDADELAGLVSLIDRSELHVDIAERLPLEDLPRVHERAEVGDVHGKIVFLPSARD
ncbi:NADP-dependent oxidoreductase [Microbacterium sp. BG28]|uniref:NADP-dependent oxidoreductase n=1 Tax=Microbacterium sp. BG28 TaxID=3097356 RepID=UPI002A59F944|nr:NADP-dependent oxidoreductase [Microbacterium sp. BG28]MDY0830061.1 NADP-dependent oxidoreductase [Microbacterium sp. BG28]